MAYGLQADLMGTTWNPLPEAVREELRPTYGVAIGARGRSTRGR